MKYHESGRPPGALGNNGPSRRRRTSVGGPLLQEWELRDRYYNEQFDERQQYLVEELLESDEDEEGVVLHGLRDFERDRTPTRQRGGGIYDGNTMMHEGGAFAAEKDYYYSDEERHYSPTIAREREEERERDEILVQSAYARIARAREKGKSNVNLTQEEMQALERERMGGQGRRTSGPQAPERRIIQLPEPSSALATPPITPAISSKNKDKVKTTSTRSSSAASLASQKKTSKKSTSLIAAAASSPAKSNSKAKVTRKGSVNLDSPPPLPELPQAPPGMRLVNGPHGVPVYAPYDYPVHTSVRGSPRSSRSRSGSLHRQRDSATPPREYPPTSISTRYRPGSSSSLRDDNLLDYDGYGRQRAGSNVRSYQNFPYGYEYDALRPNSHQQQQEFYGQGEPVRYANLRRMPPRESLVRESFGRDGPLQRVPSSESSGSEEAGVRVEVSANENGGYAVRREEGEGESGGKEKKEKVRSSAVVRKRKGKK